VGRFRDRVVVVTGAAGGIGRAEARRFASEGARVVLVDIAVAGLEESQAAVESAGGEAVTVEADVTRGADVRRYVAAAQDRFRGIDLFFNGRGARRLPVERGCRLRQRRRVHRRRRHDGVTDVNAVRTAGGRTSAARGSGSPSGPRGGGSPWT
jgi:NAD(P)-dependent dehydrogenase (short-subunit alcohol dehydrogenase family)